MRTPDDILLEEAYKKVTDQKCGCEIFDEFVEKRRAGAIKIASAAEAKGSYSTLTMYHFKAKEKPYADVFKHREKEDKSEYYKKKTEEVLERLKGFDKLSQKEFQALTGVLEVYGEVYLQSINEKDYSK
jgi:Lhr-like helicase